MRERRIQLPLMISKRSLTQQLEIRFGSGIATEVLNPKTALFFLSFIPQFINHGAGQVFLQFVALGTASVVLYTCADLLIILLAGPLGKKIRSSTTFRRRQRTVTGAIMVGLGTYLATSENRQAD